MTKASRGKPVGPRAESWRQRIAEQVRSGLSVKRFCQQQGLTEPSFYCWRKRLAAPQPIRFALVETGSGRPPATPSGLELLLTTGERLRIGADVDATVLRRVLDVLRA